MRILKQSRSSEKCKRGDPLGFLKIQFDAKYQNKIEGGNFEGKKNSKNSHSLLSSNLELFGSSEAFDEMLMQVN